MKPHHKATHRQQAESHHQHQTNSEGVHEFADPEEMLQFDASATEVPPKVAQRLQRSLGPAKVSWWKRLFGG
jgi:hypothetical protein